MNSSKTCRFPASAALAASAAAVSLLASSHREAPLITETPKLDCTDFYMFRSYEPGREDYVTFVANYLPLQDAYGGPNYFSLDPTALYEIHIDNSGDAVEDLTFQFKFENKPRDIALPIGPEGNRQTNAIPLLAAGPIAAGNNAVLNLDQTYSVALVRGPRRTGNSAPLANAANGSTTFTKPMDNMGAKTFPDYNAYAAQYIYEVSIPGTAKRGKVFVGQRKDPFVVNLGETFDLVNISTSPLGPVDANKDSLAYKNVTSIILEIPIDALVAPDKPIIGAWTTASKPQTPGDSGSLKQVSRLSNPLVNEVVIGLKDKDKFNASEPKDDLQFAAYVTHPTLPAILELLYGAAGVKAPAKFPREDLLAVFVTGVDGLTKNGSLGEMIRLNTGIPPTPRDQQKNMGVLAGDNAGFPNGRRLGDDVVDMALRVVMGILLPEADAPSGKLPFTDGAYVDAKMFLPAFPYLNPPLAGSPNDPTVILSVQAASPVGAQFKGMQATYDPATKTVQTAKPAGASGVFRTLSDSRVELTGVKIDENTAELGIKAR